MNQRRYRRRGGFTLMEVLLVLAILVILGSLVAMSFSNVMGESDRKAAKSQIGLFEPAIKMYFFDVKQYPTSLESLMSLPGDIPNPARWKGPYLEKAIPLDPWDRPYQYSYPGRYNSTSYDIWSLGPDGADGTADDVGNWPDQLGT
jgi:general secretion pathway protein G